jgi:hypothetical protein
MTVGGGEAGLGKEWKKERISTRVSINLTSIPRTHILVIDHRVPITATSPPKPPFHLHTTTTVPIKFSTKHYPLISTVTSFSGHARCNPSAEPANDTPLYRWNDQSQFIVSLALVITKETNPMQLPEIMGISVFRGGNINKFIKV